MEAWQIGDFAKQIPGASRNTVDNWFKQLEENGLHYVNRNDFGEKVYDTLDLQIAKYIKARRDEKWNLPAIFLTLPEAFELRSNIIPEEKETGLMSIEELKKEMEKVFSDKLAAMEESLRKTAAAAADEKLQAYQLEQQRLLPSPEEERRRRFDEMMLHRRLERRLQDRARQEWDKLSEEERTVRTGLFGRKRIEDIEKKNRFIADYVDERYEQELRQELDTDAG